MCRDRSLYHLSSNKWTDRLFILLKAWMNIIKYFFSAVERHYFLILLKVIYSPAEFVCRMKWRILRYDWSESPVNQTPCEGLVVLNVRFKY